MRIPVRLILPAILALVAAAPVLAAETPRSGFVALSLTLPETSRPPRHLDERFMLLPNDDAGLPPSSLHVGPFIFESDRQGRVGHYRVDGVNVLGGSLGGSVDGRGAKLELRWKQDN